MRIWSVHPKYLDAKGLVALWRETLLAKNVLEGKTKGYTNHPQLIRFKESEKPLNCIHLYLNYVWQEANARNYHFDESKFDHNIPHCSILLTSGQLEYERQHLLNKLKTRDYHKFLMFEKIVDTEIHPIFELIKGGIEKWERI